MLHRFRPICLYRNILTGIVIGICLTLPHSASAQPTEKSGVLSPKGPLPHRNSEPLNTPFLAPTAIDAHVLRRGKSRFDLNIDIVNNLLTLDQEAPKKYVVDFEEQRFYLNYGRGLGKNQELDLRLLYIDRDGGILEGFIEGFHSLFGFKGGGRDQFPKGRKLFQVNNAAGGTIINDSSAHSGFGDTLLEYRYALATLPDSETNTRNIGLTGRFLVKLPTGNKNYLFGSGKTDLGFGFAATARPLRNLALHGNTSLVFVGKPSNTNFAPKRTLPHTLLAAEYLFDGRTSAVLQSDDNPAPIRSGLAYADRTRRAFTFGLWREVGKGRQVYISNSENDFGVFAKNAPDFVLSMGTRWLLP